MLASEGYTDACQHVYVLWAPLFDEQLVGSTGNTSLPKMKSKITFFKEQYPNDNASEFIASIISLAAILETEANVTKMF